MEEPVELLMILTTYSHRLPPYIYTHARLPAKRSLLLLKVVFHVSSTLLDKKAECDRRDGKKRCNKVHLCLPAGGSWWEPNPSVPWHLHNRCPLNGNRKQQANLYFVLGAEKERETEGETQGGLLFSYSLSAENDYGYTILVAYFHDGWHSQGGWLSCWYCALSN